MQERDTIGQQANNSPPFRILNREEYLALGNEARQEAYLDQILKLRNCVHPVDGELYEGKPTQTFGYKDEILPAWWHWNELPEIGGRWVKTSDRPDKVEKPPRQMTQEEEDEFERTDRYGGMYRN